MRPRLQATALQSGQPDPILNAFDGVLNMSEALLVACPHCHTRNRVPADKLGAGGKCGRCKEALFAGKPINLGAANFEAHAGADLPLLVDFWAEWCGPCKQFAPVFNQAAAQEEPRLRFAKVDTEAEPALAQRHGIRSIPTLILFRRGREIARLSGALPPAQLKAWLQEQMVKSQ